MKTIVMLLALAGAVALALPLQAFAQRAEAYSRAYDPNTVETVSGHVTSVLYVVPHGARGSHGEHVVLNTKQGRLVVHLGPEWFMERQSLQLKVHDFITVTGSRVRLGDEAVLIAARIFKGHQTLVLRDVHGRPMWHRSK